MLSSLSSLEEWGSHGILVAKLLEELWRHPRTSILGGQRQPGDSFSLCTDLASKINGGPIQPDSMNLQSFLKAAMFS